jgi:hypothetical protein
LRVPFLFAQVKRKQNHVRIYAYFIANIRQNNFTAKFRKLYNLKAGISVFGSESSLKNSKGSDRRQ